MELDSFLSPSLIQNLQFVSLYIYDDKFIIQPNVQTTSINHNLSITKSNYQFEQLGKSAPIPGNYINKGVYSAFLGVLKILRESFLVFVESCEKICCIQGQDIFEVRNITIVPFAQEKQILQQEAEVANKIYNYLYYLKNSLLKEGYYFSYGYELTLSRTAYAEGYPARLNFAWNHKMGEQLLKLQDKNWFVYLIQGSIKSFKHILQGDKFEYILISRRSWKKGGTRYNARGVNSKGHVANFCETEQLILIGKYCFSSVQIRGSVPVFWKQSGIYAELEFYKTHAETKQAFKKHFNKMQEHYSKVFCLNLLSKQKVGETELTLYFQRLIKECNLSYLRYEFYDFHFACKGQQFQRSNSLIRKLAPIHDYFAYYVEDMSENRVVQLQRGVIRTNCLDCLDRTNLVQSKVAYEVLNTILKQCGVDILKNFSKESIVEAADGHGAVDQFIINLKNIWADNGDLISKHYTGTGSTHTNVTRTGKRDLLGIMDHGFKTLTRFYNQYMEDNYKQEVIDLILGEHTQTINLHEFEVRMNNQKADENQFVEL